MFLEIIYIFYLVYSQYNTISLTSLTWCISRECDNFTCESAQTRHCCTATRNEIMSTTVFASRSGCGRRRDITRAAAGKDLQLRGMQTGEPVINWGGAPVHACSPGPNRVKYEQFRARAGAHLVFNAFWKIQHFSVHQMLMSDPMHQIDLGAIVHLIRVILRRFD